MQIALWRIAHEADAAGDSESAAAIRLGVLDTANAVKDALAAGGTGAVMCAPDGTEATVPISCIDLAVKNGWQITYDDRGQPRVGKIEPKG